MAVTNEVKNRVKAAKLDHDLHVAILMKREGLSKPDAIVMAYLDGLLGLDTRLNGATSPTARTEPAKP